MDKEFRNNRQTYSHKPLLSSETVDQMLTPLLFYIRVYSQQSHLLRMWRRCIDEAGVVDVIGIVFAIIGGKEGERETGGRV